MKKILFLIMIMIFAVGCSKEFSAKVEPNEKVPNFQLEDLNGKKHESSEFLKDGKKTLFIVAAEWCPHCRSEAPEVQKFYDEYKNLFKEFEVFSEIVELREAGKYFTDKFKEIAICLLPEEQYYPSLDNKRRKFYDTLLPEAEPIWLAESEDTFNVSKIGVVKKTFYFSERYHIRTYKNGIEDGIRIVYFWEKDLKAEEYYVNGKFQARVNVYSSDGDKEIYYMRKNKDGLYEKYGKYIYFFKDRMISEGYYSNNEKTGDVTYFHLDGTYRKGYQEKGHLIMETSILYDIYGNIIKGVSDK